VLPPITHNLNKTMREISNSIVDILQHTRRVLLTVLKVIKKKKESENIWLREVRGILTIKGNMVS
jgi:hypothetical protein